MKTRQVPTEKTKLEEILPPRTRQKPAKPAIVFDAPGNNPSSTPSTENGIGAQLRALHEFPPR